MVWKIRSKTAYTFEFGHHRYIIAKSKSVPTELINEIPLIMVKSDTYSQIKIIHNYRNTSRACKQFLLGDPVAEQLMLTTLRTEFLWPIKNIRSPIYNYVPIQRILGDHTDRHFALVSNNQHPMQLYLYEFLNKKYRKEQQLKDYKAGKGPLTFDIAMKETVEKMVSEKLKTKDVENGEVLTPDEVSEIYKEATEDVRAKMNLITRTRGKTGEVEDYLETRRPLGEAEKRI